MLTQEKYRMTFTGLSALVFNNPEFMLLERPQDIRPLEFERQHFLEKMHRNGSKEFVLPGQEIRKRFGQICTHVDIPKQKGFQAVRSWAGIVETSLIIPDDFVLEVEYSKILPWSAIVSLDPGKGRKSPKGPRVRPLVPLPWSATGLVTSLDPRLNEITLGLIAEAAGAKKGFGDAITLGYGRAEITLKRV